MQRILAGKHSSWTSYYWWSLGWVANIYLLNNYVESNSIPFVFKDQGLKSLSLLTGFSLQMFCLADTMFSKRSESKHI